MKEIPILFTPELAQLVHEGKKTVTRRPISRDLADSMEDGGNRMVEPWSVEAEAARAAEAAAERAVRAAAETETEAWAAVAEAAAWAARAWTWAARAWTWVAEPEAEAVRVTERHWQIDTALALL